MVWSGHTPGGTLLSLQPETGASALDVSNDEQAMQLLVEAIQQLSLARDLPTIVGIVRRAARALTGADGATFILREDDKCYYVDEDAIAPLWKGKRFPMTACVSGWAMVNRRSLVIKDIYVDPRVPVDAYRPTFVKSLAMVPIRVEDPLGAIGNYWATEHEASPREVELLQTLANSTATAVENVQMYGWLEKRVQERTAQLEEANKELEAFSFSVSHDLRAPLRLIDGYSKLLLQRAAGSLDERCTDHVHTIRGTVERMDRLIDALLKVSQVMRTEPKKEEVDLTRMGHEVVAELVRHEPERKVEVRIDEGLTAEGDVNLLRVVVQNLLANAWKFTGRREDARIRFGAMMANGERVYFVEDNGAGFDMAYSHKLFNAFQRLHTDSEFPGTGVGLATVGRIIRKHGGRVWADAAVDEGATISFTLPSGS